MSVEKDGKFYMAGTDGIGEYEVLCVAEAGRLGVRQLGSSEWRLRYESDHNDMATFAIQTLWNWTVPTPDKLWLSILVNGEYRLADELTDALDFLKTWSVGSIRAMEFAPVRAMPYRQVLARWKNNHGFRPTVEEVVTSFAAALKRHAR